MFKYGEVIWIVKSNKENNIIELQGPLVVGRKDSDHIYFNGNKRISTFDISSGKVKCYSNPEEAMISYKKLALTEGLLDPDGDKFGWARVSPEPRKEDDISADESPSSITDLLREKEREVTTPDNHTIPVRDGYNSFPTGPHWEQLQRGLAEGIATDIDRNIIDDIVNFHPPFYISDYGTATDSTGGYSSTGSIRDYNRIDLSNYITGGYTSIQSYVTPVAPLERINVTFTIDGTIDTSTEVDLGTEVETEEEEID